MKYIKLFESKAFENIPNEVRLIFAELIDIIGQNNLTIVDNTNNIVHGQPNKKHFKINANYSIEHRNGEIQTMISDHLIINNALTESMDCIYRMEEYYIVNYTLLKTTYHRNFSSFELNLDIITKIT